MSIDAPQIFKTLYRNSEIAATAHPVAGQLSIRILIAYPAPPDGNLHREILEPNATYRDEAEARDAVFEIAKAWIDERLGSA